MRTLKSGVYFVKLNDIKNFLKDAQKNEWQYVLEQYVLDDPQKHFHELLTILGRKDETIKQSAIPFSLDKEKRRVGFWINKVCLESEIEETMENWNDWRRSEKHIEFYQSKKLIL